jgi:hypothetical protein
LTSPQSNLIIVLTLKKVSNTAKMRLSLVPLALLALWPLAVLGVSTYPFSQEEIDNGLALKRLAREAVENIKWEDRDSRCRFEDAQIRKEW